MCFYVVAREFYTNLKAVVRSDWIEDEEYEKKSTIYSFFDEDLSLTRNNAIKYNKKLKFDGLVTGFFKFVVSSWFDSLLEAKKSLNTRIPVVPNRHREINDSIKYNEKKDKNKGRKIDPSTFPGFMTNQIQILNSVSVI